MSRGPVPPLRSITRGHTGWLGVAAGMALWPALVAAADAGSADQPAAVLPGWAVLVLQPVGDKRVRPVTGAVVTPGGAVIVPADFAAEGDILIVLDGGTDVIEHGRAATVRARDEAAGITLLDVPGLARQPARFAAGLPHADAAVQLSAFPPAEQIAAGAAPLHVAARFGELAAAPGGASQETTSPAGRLPNVSGPLIDACGLLAGYSIAAGVPGMEPAPGTRYTWSAALLPALRSMGVEAKSAACGAGAVDGAGAPGGVPETATPATAGDTGAPAAEPEAGTDAGAVRAAAEERRTRWPLLAWVAAAIGALGAALVWRRRHHAPRMRAAGLLQETVIGQRGRTRATAESPVSTAGGWSLEVRGELPSGAEFQRHCAVSPAAVDAVIGSAAADITIDAPGIGREHARLGGSAGAMTLCCLGAAGGTWINRVPLSRGEIMFLAEGDTVVLGETSFRIRLVAPGADRPTQ